MFNDDNFEIIDRFSRGIIRRKVRQLIGVAGFTKQDREDLEQDLYLRVLQSLPSFDSNQGHRNKFITAVVERHVANILRNKRAEKRDHRRISSLNVPVDLGEEGVADLADLVSQREYDARRGRRPRNDEELAQLRQDLADVSSKLPEDLRELVERLKTQTVTEVARDMSVPRTTLNGTVKRLRQRFQNAGLKDYL